jgi:RNA-directed DNA polymerase
LKPAGRGDAAREDEKPPLEHAKSTVSTGCVCECVKRTETKRKDNEYPEGTENLVERMVERGNMMAAYDRVKKNAGAAGIDGMTTEKLMPYLQKEWAKIKEELLKGKYKPQPVKRVEIPKPNGGVRQLGIPTVVDRLIQQAMYQVLEPIFEPTFSEHSFGFRKNRSAHDAIKACKKYVTEGRKYVVDTDIRKFFDEVNHVILLKKVRMKIRDKRIINLIRACLKSGVMTWGVVEPSERGTPQGGPISPLLSNIMLDELDKELEKRGHAFARYADDCNIYVRSKRAGLRVYESVKGFLEKKLKLTVNPDKSSVDYVNRRKFLGYTILSGKEVKIGVARESVKRFKSKVKEVFETKRHLSMEKLVETINEKTTGWIEYFKLADTRRFAEELDEWIRRKLRRKIWKDWKYPWTKARNLIKAGLNEKQAYRSGFNERGNWWNAGAMHMGMAFPTEYFKKKINLVSIKDRLVVAL